MTFSFAISHEFLSQQIFVFLAVFARLGAMLMTMPALGAESVPTNIRLVLALVLTATLTGLVINGYPVLPQTLFGLITFILAEIIIGLVIGGILRMVMSAVQVAGTLIAFQSSLAFAQNFDPTQGVQGALIGTFLSIAAVTVIFATNMHHLLLAALHDSYAVFPAGGQWPWSEFSEMALNTLRGAFVVGVQLSAPFITVGLVFYLGVGVLSKLMPQVQIFFIAMPANIMLGFAILMLCFSAMMLWFGDFFERTVGLFLN